MNEGSKEGISRNESRTIQALEKYRSDASHRD